MAIANGSATKRRAGIVSLFGLYNYGNRLQGHAVTSMLDSIGIEPTTIVFYRKLGLSVLKAELVSLSARLKHESAIAARNRRFQQFISAQRIQYIHWPHQIGRLHQRFDYFVVGSDQVWHPQADLYAGTKLLKFARPNQRIALAPSFGVTEIAPQARDEYRLALSSYKHLSVREQEGADLVEGLVGARPQVLPDPTIGLTRDEWSTIALSGERPSDRYVLVYFLGGLSERKRMMVEDLAATIKARIIDLTDQSTPEWASGPQDFVALIEGATFVLTDSYHASIFSIIFEVPFYVFRREERESTYSRIGTLLRTLGLERHEANELTEGLPDEDFSSARRLLASQRDDLIQFVRASVGQ